MAIQSDPTDANPFPAEGGARALEEKYNLANARSYFAEHVAVGDYYAQGQQVAGNWFGPGAERLGLQGPVKSEELLRRLVTGWENQVLFELLNHQYADLTDTVIAGNLGRSEFEADLGPSLLSRLLHGP